jgi:predicted ArsR family transcriptional regulator
MRQPDLFDKLTGQSPQSWRNSDPETSRLAGQAAAQFKSEHHRAIYRALAEAHPRPLAAEQIGDALGWPHYHAVGRRLSELVDAGLIERAGELHKNRTGRQAERYRIREHAS